jgi:hypothetical protein
MVFILVMKLHRFTMMFKSFLALFLLTSLAVGLPAKADVTLLDMFNGGACALAVPTSSKQNLPSVLLDAKSQKCINEYKKYFAADFERLCPPRSNCRALILPSGDVQTINRDRLLDLSRKMNTIDSVINKLSVLWTTKEHRERLGILMYVDAQKLKEALVAVGLTELMLRHSDFGEAMSEDVQDLLSRSPIGGRTISGGGKVDLGIAKVGMGDGNPTVGIFQVSQALAYQMEDRYLKHTTLATAEDSRIKDDKKRIEDRNRKIRSELPNFEKNAAVAAANLLHLLLNAYGKGFNLTDQPGLHARFYHRGIGHMGESLSENTYRVLSATPYRPNFSYPSLQNVIPLWDSYAYFVEGNWPTIHSLAQ